MRFHILYNVIIEDIYFVMTKEEVEIIIKRYYYISRAMKENSERAVFYIGKRKHVIPVTDEIKIIFDIVDKIYKAEQEAPIRLMIQLMKAGEKDVYIMREIHYSKNSYYEHKDAFIEKVYQCCIYHKLVSLEEILGGKSA